MWGKCHSGSDIERALCLNLNIIAAFSGKESTCTLEGLCRGQGAVFRQSDDLCGAMKCRGKTGRREEGEEKVRVAGRGG